MGGFEHYVIASSEKIQKIVNAVEQWRKWLAENHPTPLDLGLLKYYIFKNADDVVWWIKDETGGWRPDKRVRDIFGDKLENGKWIIYWFEIEWLNKIPLPTLMRLKQACKENGCLDFWNELVSASGRLSAEVIDMLSRTLKGAMIEENREW